MLEGKQGDILLLFVLPYLQRSDRHSIRDGTENKNVVQSQKGAVFFGQKKRDHV